MLAIFKVVVLVAAVVAVASAGPLFMHGAQPELKSSAESEAFNCDACVWVINKVEQEAAGHLNCSYIEPLADKICGDVPIPVVGPFVCDWLVKRYCPTLVQYLSGDMNATSVCTRIGLCAGSDSACHSIGKSSDNGRCTALLANSSNDWRLEWNLLPWWKNKGCNPPEHFGDQPVYCSEEHIGCCLSGWTPHAVMKGRN